MARPRIFLSSTFYDLRYVRNDLERFIHELGYEPVMAERGQIPYGRVEALEQYCYREINNCDIVVHVIGGRFGSPSKEEPYSISQIELKTAQELQKQVYICVERSVHVEYRTYLKNEDNPDFRPQYVDDLKIYKFLKEVYALSSNNVVLDFDSVSEMIEYLRDQWAGLFQRFLQEESRREDYRMSANLKSTAETLAKIIEYTTTERDETIKSILVYGHPVFLQLKEATGIAIRIFFSDYEEMETLLRVFGFSRDIFEEDGQYFYERGKPGNKTIIRIAKDIFDDNSILKPVEEGQWDRKFVEVERDYISEDDIPF